MLRQLQSTSKTKNDLLKPLTRLKGEDNLQWGARAVAEMGTGGSDGWTYVVLLGGNDTLSFRLRVAQSHLRSDMLPSYWSEAVLARLRGENVARARALHVPLLQPAHGVFATRTNGVETTALYHRTGNLCRQRRAITLVPLVTTSLRLLRPGLRHRVRLLFKGSPRI